MAAKSLAGWSLNRSRAPEQRTPTRIMNSVSSDPGSGRGLLRSGDRTDVFNPLGLLTGEAAICAVKAGTARPLAGGPVAFSSIERLYPTGSGAIGRSIGSVDGVPEPLSVLTDARPPFAGIDLSRPAIMGVVNVTPDSFSDGGDYYDPPRAIERALALAAEGADLIDIGGESTRPGALPMAGSEEIDRVLPVVEAAVAAGITVSVDTRRSAVMKAVLVAGASVINDVTALAGDEASSEIIAAAGASAILMHMRGAPETMQHAPAYRLASFDVFEWLAARVDACVAAGIPRDRIAVDPGIGFGKTDRHNLDLLDRAGVFHGTGCAVAIGVSRKSFIGRLAGIDASKDRLPGTIAATTIALSRGVQIHRVHDVAAVGQAISIWNSLNNPLNDPLRDNA